MTRLQNSCDGAAKVRPLFPAARRHCLVYLFCATVGPLKSSVCTRQHCPALNINRKQETTAPSLTAVLPCRLPITAHVPGATDVSLALRLEQTSPASPANALPASFICAGRQMAKSSPFGGAGRRTLYVPLSGLTGAKPVIIPQSFSPECIRPAYTRPAAGTKCTAAGLSGERKGSKSL